MNPILYDKGSLSPHPWHVKRSHQPCPQTCSTHLQAGAQHMLQQRLRRPCHRRRHRDVVARPCCPCCTRGALLLLGILAGRQPLAGWEGVEGAGDDGRQLARHAAPQRRLCLVQPSQLGHAVHQRCRHKGAHKGGWLLGGRQSETQCCTGS